MVLRSDEEQIRYLCWDEENRLMTVHDDGNIPMVSSYIYDAGGERVWKLSNNESSLRLRGNAMMRTMQLKKTLYISPLMVMTDKEYTKHYFIEGERVCTKVGGGFRYASTDPDAVQLSFMGGSTAQTVADDLWSMTLRGVDCSTYPTGQVSIDDKLRPARNDASRVERQQYFFHPDHLGSSSFVTDAAGLVEEHLQYLPYGEVFVQQQAPHSDYDTRYKFSAKELDPETNYSYFGARYYDSDLSIFFSIDPICKEFPHTSPYTYCLNNPNNFNDPNGLAPVVPPWLIIGTYAHVAFTGAMLSMHGGIRWKPNYFFGSTMERADLLYFGAGKGSVWELKSRTTLNHPIRRYAAVTQVNRYISTASKDSRTQGFQWAPGTSNGNPVPFHGELTIPYNGFIFTYWIEDPSAGLIGYDYRYLPVEDPVDEPVNFPSPVPVYNPYLRDLIKDRKPVIPPPIGIPAGALSAAGAAEAGFSIGISVTIPVIVIPSVLEILFQDPNNAIPREM